MFHGTNFAAPYVPRRPSVLTLHDLSPRMDRAWHSDAGRVRQRTPLLIGLGFATMIVTPSQAVRKQPRKNIPWIWYWPGGADAISRNFHPNLGCRLLVRYPTSEGFVWGRPGACPTIYVAAAQHA